MSEHFLDRNMLSSELCAFSLGALHGSLEDASGVSELEFVDGGKHVGICEEGFLVVLLDLVIFHFGVDACLGLVVDPLANEELVLVVVEVGSLTLAHVVDPVALEVVSVSLGEDSVAVAFPSCHCPS